MTGLLDRLRAAAGPDRAFDAEVARAVGWARHDDPGRVLRWLAPDGRWHDDVPAYTASLDGAASLVPDGWSWTVTSHPQGTWACATAADGTSGTDAMDAATPALALCCAALSARGVS